MTNDMNTNRSKIATNSFGFELNEFSLDLAYIGELPQRLHRTANMLRQLTDSNGVKLYLVDKIYNEIYFCPNEENVSSHRTSWSISERFLSLFIALW